MSSQSGTEWGKTSWLQTVSPDYMRVEVVLRGGGNVMTDCCYVSKKSVLLGHQDSSGRRERQ